LHQQPDNTWKVIASDVGANGKI